MMRFQNILAKEKIKSDFNKNLKHLKKRKIQYDHFSKIQCKHIVWILLILYG